MARDRIEDREAESKACMPQNDSEILAGEIFSAQQNGKMIEAPSRSDWVRSQRGI